MDSGMREGWAWKLQKHSKLIQTIPRDTHTQKLTSLILMIILLVCLKAQDFFYGYCNSVDVTAGPCRAQVTQHLAV